MKLRLVAAAAATMIAAAAASTKTRTAAMRRNDSRARTLKTKECEDSCAASFPEALDLSNCANRCVSPGCYYEVYEANGQAPLEPGEVDAKRAKLFATCLTKGPSSDRQPNKQPSNKRRKLSRRKRRALEEEEAAKNGAAAGDADAAASPPPLDGNAESNTVEPATSPRVLS